MANPVLSMAPARMWMDSVGPTPDDDSTKGYDVGNWWINTVTNELFQALSVAEAAADWQLKPSQISQSFTPSLSFGGLMTGITYSASGQSGLYFRIGNVVYLNIFLQLTSKGTAVGNATISSLPFPAASGIKPKGLMTIRDGMNLSTDYNNIVGRINAGSSQIALIETTDVSPNNFINATDTNFENDSILQIDGFYFI